MNKLSKIVFDAIKLSSKEKKSVCLQKGLKFTGVYFHTILEYIKKANENGAFPKRSFGEKINAIFEERKIKKQLNKFIKEGAIERLHIEGGFMFILKEDYEALLMNEKRSTV